MSNRKAGAKTSVPTKPASGDAGDGGPRPGLPPRRKEARYGWRTDISSLPPEEQTKALVARIEWIRDHPDTKAKRIVQAHLQAAHLDPALRASPSIARVVAFMRELLQDHRPGEELEHLLGPVATLLARHGGGRPKNEAIWAEWARSFEALRRSKPSLTAEERYEEVAADWAAEGHRPVTWRTVRNSISKLKKPVG